MMIFIPEYSLVPSHAIPTDRPVCISLSDNRSALLLLLNSVIFFPVVGVLLLCFQCRVIGTYK